MEVKSLKLFLYYRTILTNNIVVKSGKLTVENKCKVII
jgi:hypothetical protein